jgi:EAL domain-containing protein (putative c-di-GMP-specific phosphodiesterase class I)
LLESVPHERVVLEITEHAVIDDYEQVLQAFTALRTRGIRLAIDDAGSGYASFRHIISLEPDFIKLDTTLTRDIDRDNRRQALVSAFVAFAGRTRSEIIAEGVETGAARDTLKVLGVNKAQGYLFGRPGPFHA